MVRGQCGQGWLDSLAAIWRDESIAGRTFVFGRLLLPVAKKLADVVYRRTDDLHADHAGLGDALARLDEDEVIKSSMPGEMYKVYKWYIYNKYFTI